MRTKRDITKLTDAELDALIGEMSGGDVAPNKRAIASRMSDADLDAEIAKVMHDQLPAGTMEHQFIREQARGMSEAELSDALDNVAAAYTPREYMNRERARKMSGQELQEKLDVVAHDQLPAGTLERQFIREQARGMSEPELSREVEKVHSSRAIRPGRLSLMSDSDLDKNIEEAQSRLDKLRRARKAR